MKHFLSTFVAASLCSFGTSHAADYIWGGGSGAWDYTNANWSDGSTLVNWVNTSGAIFGGPDGSYAITTSLGNSSTTYQVSGITLNNSGFTLQATATQRINIIGTGLITVANGKTGTVGANLEIFRNGAVGVSGGGTLNVENGGFLHGAGSTGSLSVTSGSTVVVKSGGAVTGIANMIVGNATGTSTLTVSGGTANGSALTGSNGLRFSGSGTVNLDSGTINTSRIYTNVSNTTYDSTFNFNGGTLQVSSQNDNTFMTGLSNAFVKDGGAIINTGAFNANIAQVLQHGGTLAKDGGLTKSGTGTLTLSAVNTFTGDTTVNAGTLILADNAGLKFVIGASSVSNKISGTGTLTLDGDFTFDLTGAATANGSLWQIVNVGPLTETFSSTFTVVGFTEVSNIWTRNVSGTVYEFSEATGQLSVIPEPATYGLLAFGGVLVLALRRRIRA